MGALKLETAAAPAAEAAAGKSSTAAEPRASGAARRRSHDASRACAHGVEVVHKPHRVKVRPDHRAAVPLGWLGINFLKSRHPLFLDAQRHGKRQKLFEHLRGLDSSFETVFFHMAQKILKPQDAFQGSRAGKRARG